MPRANTMLIWRPDRFGLAQLHQLRGRVGRGRRQGFTYLLSDPEAPMAAATEARLQTLEALDRLGAGFAISGRDLDLRGGGDLRIRRQGQGQGGLLLHLGRQDADLQPQRRRGRAAQIGQGPALGDPPGEPGREQDRGRAEHEMFHGRLPRISRPVQCGSADRMRLQLRRQVREGPNTSQNETGAADAAPVV